MSVEFNNVQIILRNATSAEWESSTIIPDKGELILYTDLNKIKMGDGVNLPKNLSFLASEAEADTTPIVEISDVQTSGTVTNIVLNTTGKLYELTKSTASAIAYVSLKEDLIFDGKIITLAASGNTSVTVNPVWYISSSGSTSSLGNITDGSGFNASQMLLLYVQGSGTAGKFNHVRLLNVPYPAAELASF